MKGLGVYNQIGLCIDGKEGTGETTEKMISVAYCIVNNYF